MTIESVSIFDLGRIISQLVREGLTFRVTPSDDGWKVELLGGY
jgi:hypothetical protein